MENPWKDLPTVAPYGLVENLELIERFNQSAKPEHLIHTGILPEPHLGDPNAPIVLLSLNPGYSPQDEITHSDRVFVEACRKCARHEPQDYPFYLLNPELPGGGFDWWSKKLKPLIELFGRERVAHKVFCVELFPYHSVKFAHHKLRVHSQDYAAYLIRNSVQKNALLVAMRGFRFWEQLVPELSEYPQLFRLNSAQNVTISAKNCPLGFPHIVEALSHE
ncbi:MAG: hypothetical protein O2868_00530 [Proteobacteria bacterium]|nr:hypothetical protein [Pseudomonadota bacterium]